MEIKVGQVYRDKRFNRETVVTRIGSPYIYVDEYLGGFLPKRFLPGPAQYFELMNDVVVASGSNTQETGINNSESTTIKLQCTCGCIKTFGEGCPKEYHSDWCDLVTGGVKK